jgi:hypothetical protein
MARNQKSAARTLYHSAVNIPHFPRLSPSSGAQTRATMLATGMERGMEASYMRLESLI